MEKLDNKQNKSVNTKKVEKMNTHKKTTEEKQNYLDQKKESLEKKKSEFQTNYKILEIKFLGYKKKKEMGKNKSYETFVAEIKTVSKVYTIDHLRYSQLLALRDHLVETYKLDPQDLPKFPKKTVGKPSIKDLEERKILFEAFFNEVNTIIFFHLFFIFYLSFNYNYFNYFHFCLFNFFFSSAFFLFLIILNIC